MTSSRGTCWQNKGGKVSMSNLDGQHHIFPAWPCGLKTNESHNCRWIPKDAKITLLKKKKMGVSFCSSQYLLSMVTLIAWTFGCMWCLDTKIIAVSLIMISYMCSTINVYQICRNVKEWNWILKHGDMSKKDVPIILRNTISSFLSSNGCEFKWTVYKSIRMGDVKPFFEQK